MSRKSVTFEEAMERLAEIVKLLEKGDVPLDESMRLFEEGTKLSAKCASLLDGAQLKVEKLMKGADGAPVEQEIQNEGI